MLALFKKYLTPYWRSLAAVVVLQFIATIASLFLPTLNAEIIDQGVAKGDTHYIITHGSMMLAVSFLQVCCQISAVYFGSRSAMAFGRDLRSAVFGKVLDFSTQEVKRFGSASLLTRSTNDVQQVQMLVQMGCNILVGVPIMMVGGVIMALREDVGLSWLIVVSVLVLGVIAGVLVSIMLPLFKQNQTFIDNLNRTLREQISGIRVVRAFAREPHERKRFQKANTDLTNMAIKFGVMFALLMPTVNIIANLASVGVMWFGGHRVDIGAIQVGQLTAFLTYLMQILMSVMMGTMLALIGPRAAVCATRVNEVLTTESSVRQPANPVASLPASGHLVFDKVSFSYPGAESPVLHELSFELHPGTTTAIIGSTGAGKTTIVNLIPRLTDPTSGRITLGGTDIRELDMDLLWSRIGLVPQTGYLFSGTVASNLRYGNPDATDAQLWQALEIAQATDFVTAMDGQLEAPIAQGGTNVSGGQRQRLSIARALLKAPEIYIFDDAFSALDVATDARLREALRPVTTGAAVLQVAQRVSTIRDADQIIVLDAGSIVGKGTHAQLLVDCPTYQEIVNSQLALEEAA